MVKKKYNILFICNKSPWPPKEGGPIAMNNLIEGMANAGHYVKVLAINTNKYSVDLNDIPESYRKKTNIELGFIDLSVKPVPAFLNLFTNESYHVKRFKSDEFAGLLKSTLEKEQFDIIQMETLFMSPYINLIRKYSDAKIVLRAHNIEHLIWKRLWQTAGNPLKKFYLKHLFTTLEKYEKEIINSFDGIVPITQKDARFFRQHTSVPVLAVPFGIDLKKLHQYKKEPEKHALFHIGAMNWIPNQEGIKWFLNGVWPRLHEENPGLEVFLAGREMPDWLKNINEEGVHVAGEVPDAYEFMGKYTISLAPLLSGSGIRIKIIESMALGKAVVATTVGAEGIACGHGKEIMLADTPQAFAGAVEKLWKDPEYCKEVGKNAAALIARDHDNEKIIEKLTAFYGEIL